MKNLIVKLGAAGDVARTTPILPFLKGDVYWLTSKISADFLPKKYIKKVFLIESPRDLEKIRRMNFDQIISLDEEMAALELLNTLRAGKIIGVYYDEKKRRVNYTKESRGWFDMGLTSRLGIKKANILKKTNRQSYQHFLFKMLGWKFSGQPYLLDAKINKRPKYAVGIEKRAGDRWPSKQWHGYDKLIKLLKKNNISYFVFRQRKNGRQYIEDINNCQVIIGGDTLAMHLGLALQKKVVALFSPTPPQEIYNYGNLTKLYEAKAPCSCSYKPHCPHGPQCIDQIKAERALSTVLAILSRL